LKALPAAWLTRGLTARLLLPLAGLFGLLSGLRRRLYRAGLLRVAKLPLPVIVVGNIFIGGTGKTPLVIWLARKLSAAGLHPGVVSRGYGGQGDAVREVLPDSPPSLAGDEPVLIALRAQCPVVVGRDRVAAARHLMQLHPQVDVVLSDDGLQHYRLPRQLELVVFDSRGVGNGWLLPAGPLREPAARLRDFTVVNGSDSAPGVGGRVFRMQLEPGNAWQLNQPSARQPLATLCAGKQVLAAAGIGNPARFFDMLTEIGLQFETLPLADHHDFSRNPFAGHAAQVILITEKDAVKCRLNPELKNDTRLWVVPVSAALDPTLAESILERLRGSPPA
jgi:tetraacyldisaccharide 4'-kinase